MGAPSMPGWKVSGFTPGKITGTRSGGTTGEWLSQRSRTDAEAAAICVTSRRKKPRCQGRTGNHQPIEYHTTGTRAAFPAAAANGSA